MAGALNLLKRSATSSTPLTVTVAPTSVSGNDSGIYGSCYTAEPAIVTPAGGVPGYTYAWAYVSGDAAIAASDPTSDATYFYAFGAAPFNKTAVWRCTVTDAASTAVISANVTITLQYTYEGYF